MNPVVGTDRFVHGTATPDNLAPTNSLDCGRKTAAAARWLHIRMSAVPPAINAALDRKQGASARFEVCLGNPPLQLDDPKAGS